MRLRFGIAVVLGAVHLLGFPGALMAGCTETRESIRVTKTTCCDADRNCYTCMWDRNELVECYSGQ
jgi:hypothetical protein